MLPGGHGHRHHGLRPEAGKQLEVQWRKLPQCLQAAGGSQQVFLELFGQDPEADCFWLDRWASRISNIHY